MVKTHCIILDGNPGLCSRDFVGTKSVYDLHAQFVEALSANQVIIAGSTAVYEVAKKSFEGLAHDFVACDLDQWSALLLTIAKSGIKNQTLSLSFASSPIYNLELAQRLYNLHDTYKAQFSFADAYIRGMAIEILETEILEPLAMLAERRHVKLTNAGLFEVVKLDVNAFDVETDIAAVDMRPLRLSGFVETTETYMSAKKIIDLVKSETQSASPELILNTVNAHEAELRFLPNYVSIQLTESCAQGCSYCPWGIRGYYKNKGMMDFGLFTKIIDDLHGLNPFATVSVSLWGEPSLYPRIIDAIGHILSKKTLSLHIETSGLGWGREKIEAISKLENAEAISFIFSLDSRDEAVYKDLRGEGYAEAWSTARYAHGLLPKQVYFQTVRSQLNEQVVQQFYKENKAEGLESIIQKFDHFSHAIPDHRVADIAPFRRNACWHLKRDIYVLLDGRVPLCREDIDNKHIIGNLKTQKLSHIFQQNQEIYESHVKKQYPSICEFCDEFYTFNA